MLAVLKIEKEMVEAEVNEGDTKGSKEGREPGDTYLEEHAPRKTEDRLRRAIDVAPVQFNMFR